MSAQTGKLPHQLVKHYLLALSLLFLSYSLFNSLEAYLIDGEQLLENPDFSEDLKGWGVAGEAERIEISDGVVAISHQSISQSSWLSQCWIRSGFPDYLLMSVQARSDRLQVGAESWHGARAGVTGFLAGGGKNYKLSSRLVRLKTDSPWNDYQVAVNVSPEFERVCFIIALYQSAGEFQFKAPSLFPLIENPQYARIKYLLMSAWLALGVWWLILFYRHYCNRPQWGYLVVVLVSIGIGILAPVELKTFLIESLFYYVPEVDTKELLAAIGLSLDSSPQFLPEIWDVSKFGHLAGFFLLSATLFSERAKPAWFLLPGLFLAALTTELMQYFVPDRTPRFSDVVVDGMGIIAGWWLVRLSLWWRQSVSA